MRRKGLAVAALLAALAVPDPARAQACAAGESGTFRLRVRPAAIAFNQPGVPEFEAGVISRAGNVRVRVRPRFGGGGPWTLCLRSQDPDLGVYGKAISDLQWRPTGSTTWQSLDTVDQLVATGQGDQTIRLQFRMLLAYALDEPGDYGALLGFTAFRQ